MGFFDLFTGAGGVRAAEQARGVYDNTRTQGNADLNAGYGTARDSIFTGNALALGNLGAGYEGAMGAANAGADGALSYINQGRDGALNRFDQAGQSLSALGQQYGAGRSLYQDSLGINGAGGNANAVNAFQQGPGYNFAMDQGVEAINRARNARGMANSGGTDRDTLQFGQGLANQEYGNWQNRLQGFMSPELQATQGAAQIGTQAGNLVNQSGIASAGIESGRGSMLADLSRAQGTAMGGINSNQGNTLASLAMQDAGSRVRLGQSIMQPYAQTYSDEANARMRGSQNLLNAGMGIASLAAGGMGGMGGLGALGGAAGAGTAGSGMLNNMQNFGFNPVSFAGR